jgi:hypothetical protein
MRNESHVEEQYSLKQTGKAKNTASLHKRQSENERAGQAATIVVTSAPEVRHDIVHI